MRLTDFIKDNSMVCGLSADSRDEVIRVLADTLASRGLVESEGEVTDGLTLMEESHTTVIGNGVAVPHATVEGVDGTLLTVAVADDPIQFGRPIRTSVPFSSSSSPLPASVESMSASWRGSPVWPRMAPGSNSFELASPKRC